MINPLTEGSDRTTKHAANPHQTWLCIRPAASRIVILSYPIRCLVLLAAGTAV